MQEARYKFLRGRHCEPDDVDHLSRTFDHLPSNGSWVEELIVE